MTLDRMQQCTRDRTTGGFLFLVCLASLGLLAQGVVQVLAL